MQPKTILQLVLAVALCAFYVLVLVAVLHPTATPDYRAYYIDHTSREYDPVRYTATPEQGITFSLPGRPSFIRSMTGFSAREAWGRWTDADQSPNPQISLAEPLSGTICLDLDARPSKAIEGTPITIAFGAQTSSLVLYGPKFAEYFIQFTAKQPSDTLEFRFPNPLARANSVDRTNPDTRRLGLAMAHLRLYPKPCSDVQPQLAVSDGAITTPTTRERRGKHHGPQR